jgi:hypothetical protein
MAFFLILSLFTHCQTETMHPNIMRVVEFNYHRYFLQKDLLI